MDSPSSKQWHYVINGTNFGPISWEELLRKFQQKEIPVSSHLWCEGMLDWAPANQIIPPAICQPLPSTVPKQIPKSNSEPSNSPKGNGAQIQLDGLQKKSIIVEENSIRIIKNASIFASQREKTLPIRNISSVEVKKPGLTSGFIQFSIAGGVARDSSFTISGGTYDAAQDENSVLFVGNENYEIALQIKQSIESKATIVGMQPIAQSAPVSVADEILKFKTLLDSGVITESEFVSKKKQLLGI